ncbi:hypothetical protein [Streptomyces sp. NE06-03C]|nr:hypothetical protein [Streptomyces sp. NE06-03C]MDX2922779.1 hypothetical protein [Streptomyces sp. NE06-03C]
MSDNTTPVDQDANATSAELIARAEQDRAAQVAKEQGRDQR